MNILFKNLEKSLFDILKEWKFKGKKSVLFIVLSGVEEILRGQPGPQTAPQIVSEIESSLILNYLSKLMMDFQIIPFTYQSFVAIFFKRHLCTPIFYFIHCSRCYFHFQTFPQSWERVWRTKCCLHSGRWPILIGIWKGQQKR